MVMDEIPHPTEEPYSEGDHVRIYLGPDDPDVHYHGMVCEVSGVMIDYLAVETERDIDAYSYVLREPQSDETISVVFRHSDLVPDASSDQS